MAGGKFFWIKKGGVVWAAFCSTGLRGCVVIKFQLLLSPLLSVFFFTLRLFLSLFFSPATFLAHLSIKTA
jgi:hypothetical protein